MGRPSIRENGHSPRIVFTIPSNPAACQVVAQLLIAPCIKRMRGVEQPDCFPVTVKATLKGDDLQCDKGLLSFHRVNVQFKGGKVRRRYANLPRQSIYDPFRR